jgi:hypothetical protein
MMSCPQHIIVVLLTYRYLNNLIDNSRSYIIQSIIMCKIVTSMRIHMFHKLVRSVR